MNLEESAFQLPTLFAPGTFNPFDRIQDPFGHLFDDQNINVGLHLPEVPVAGLEGVTAGAELNYCPFDSSQNGGRVTSTFPTEPLLDFLDDRLPEPFKPIRSLAPISIGFSTPVGPLGSHEKPVVTATYANGVTAQTDTDGNDRVRFPQSEDGLLNYRLRPSFFPKVGGIIIEGGKSKIPKVYVEIQSF